MNTRRPNPMKSIKKYFPVLFFIVLCVGGAIWASYTPKLGCGTPVDRAELRDKAIPVITEAVKLMISLATLVFGGIGLLIFREKGQVRCQSKIEVYLMIACLVAAALGIYYSFATYLYIVEFLDLGVYRFALDPLQDSLMRSYYCVAFAVFLLGIWFVQRIIIGSEESSQ